MKLLFYSSDRSEVELASRELQHAGVPCEVRSCQPKRRSSAKKAAKKELWLENDLDAHKALNLCVQLGVGFGKPPVSWPLD